MTDNSQDTNPNLDGLDEFRLALTRDDCKLIDVDNSGSLNLLELTRVVENDLFRGGPGGEEKHEAVTRLRDFLGARETTSIDKDTDAVPSMRLWNHFDTALDNISKDEFEIVDENLDGILSFKELKDGANNPSLSEVGRLAVRSLVTNVEPHDILDTKGDLTIGDERNLVGPIGISDWHELNPKFKNVSSSSLRENAKTKTEQAVSSNDEGVAADAIEHFEELLRRAELIQPGSLGRQIEEFKVCVESFDKNVGLERDSSGRLRLNGANAPRRADIEQYLGDLVQARYLARRDRVDYANFMYKQEYFPEAERLYQEAIAHSDILTTKPHGSKDSLSEVMKRSWGYAWDSPHSKPLHSGRPGIEVLRAPVESRIEKAMFYMAPVVRDNNLDFDSTAAHFQPDKAQSLINGALEQGKSLYSLDLSDPREANSSVANYYVMNAPHRMNPYKDENKNGQSDIIEHLKNQIGSRRYIELP